MHLGAPESQSIEKWRVETCWIFVPSQSEKTMSYRSMLVKQVGRNSRIQHQAYMDEDVLKEMGTRHDNTRAGRIPTPCKEDTPRRRTCVLRNSVMIGRSDQTLEKSKINNPQALAQDGSHWNERMKEMYADTTSR